MVSGSRPASLSQSAKIVQRSFHGSLYPASGITIIHASREPGRCRTPLWPKPADIGWVPALDRHGHILENLQDSDGTRLKEITSVEESNGYLYLGSLHNDRIGKLALSQPNKGPRQLH